MIPIINTSYIPETALPVFPFKIMERGESPGPIIPQKEVWESDFDYSNNICHIGKGEKNGDIYLRTCGMVNNTNIIIFGNPGSGKSTWLSKLIHEPFRHEDFCPNRSIVVFDRVGETNSFDMTRWMNTIKIERGHTFNLLHPPPNATPNQHVQFVKKILIDFSPQIKKVFETYVNAEEAFSYCCKELFTGRKIHLNVPSKNQQEKDFPCVEDLCAHLTKSLITAPEEYTKIFEDLYSGLNTFAQNYPIFYGEDVGLPLDSIFDRGLHFVVLDDLKDEDTKTMFVRVMLNLVLSEMTSFGGHSNSYPLTLVFDEAHMMLKKEIVDKRVFFPNAKEMEELATTGRKYGINLILSMPTTENIPSTLLNCASTFVIFRTNMLVEENKVGLLENIPDEVNKGLSNYPTRTFCLVTNFVYDERPFFICQKVIAPDIYLENPLVTVYSNERDIHEILVNNDYKKTPSFYKSVFFLQTKNNGQIETYIGKTNDKIVYKIVYVGFYKKIKNVLFSANIKDKACCDEILSLIDMKRRKNEPVVLLPLENVEKKLNESVSSEEIKSLFLGLTDNLINKHFT